MKEEIEAAIIISWILRTGRGFSSFNPTLRFFFFLKWGLDVK